jgi:hypothetical protein
MAEAAVTPRQMRRLQTLWGLFCRQLGLGRPGDTREARLAWVGGQVGRQISSCSDLSRGEAERAIDALQASLPPELVRRRRPGRREARELGTAGRRGIASGIARPAGAKEISQISQLLARLGWDNARLAAFLRSRSGPLRGRAMIRTLADANRVRWALKALLKRSDAKAESSPPPQRKDAEASPAQIEA